MRSWTEKGKVVFFFSHFSLGWSEIWVLTEYGTCKSVDLCISCHSGKQWRRWEVGAEEEGSESLSGTGKWNFIFIASINNRNFKLWLCKTAKKKMSKLHIINATLHCGDVCQFLHDMYRYILCVGKNMITIVVIFILCPPPRRQCIPPLATSAASCVWELNSISQSWAETRAIPHNKNQWKERRKCQVQLCASARPWAVGAELAN